MIRVVATHKIPEGNLEPFLVLGRQIIEKSRKDPGNVYYTLSQALDDPTNVAMIEGWESMGDLEAHMQTDHFKTLCPQMAEYCEGDIQVVVYNDLVD